MLVKQPDGPPPDFGRIFGSMAHHSNLSRRGASDNPGAIQSYPAPESQFATNNIPARVRIPPVPYRKEWIEKYRPSTSRGTL
jgi:hypothetical protein